MKKILLTVSVLLAVGCSQKKVVDNTPSYPIREELVVLFDRQMSNLRDSISQAQAIGDTFMLVKYMTDWENLYLKYCYNSFRELNLNFHQDSTYQSAYHYIKDSWLYFGTYAHLIHTADSYGAEDITNFLMERSDAEVRRADW